VLASYASDPGLRKEKEREREREKKEEGGQEELNHSDELEKEFTEK
jgi:hypothetical protein